MTSRSFSCGRIGRPLQVGYEIQIRLPVGAQSIQRFVHFRFEKTMTGKEKTKPCVNKQNLIPPNDYKAYISATNVHLNFTGVTSAGGSSQLPRGVTMRECGPISAKF